MFFFKGLGRLFPTAPMTHSLTPAEMRAGQKRIICYSTISMLFSAGLNERVISLFVLHIQPDISDSALACFFAIPPVLGVLTALISPLVDIIGKKRIMKPMYLLSAPFVAMLIGIPWLLRFLSPGITIVVLALILAGYYATRSLGFAGWFPMINDNVPADTRGRFFGRLRTTWQIALIICTAVLGWFFGNNPELWRFQVVFGFALLANLVGTFVILSVPEQPVMRRNAAKSFFKMMMMPFRNKVFVNFMIFGALFSLASGLASQFSIRCLKTTLGAGDNTVVWMEMFGSIGAAFTLPLWGRFVDRFGSRAIFTLLLPPLALVNLIWLIMSPDLTGWRIWLGVYYVAHGILIFGIGVGTTDVMLGSSGRAFRSAYINMAFVINTLAMGLAPFLGTLVTRLAGDWTGHWGWLWLDGNRLVFVLRCLLMLLPLFMINGISRRYGGEVRSALGHMTRSARRMVGMNSETDQV